jgi:uncharacterized protein YecE (DUF72 family)
VAPLRHPGRVYIGTAGWALPRIHQAHFGANGTHLERYSAVFSATEINSSFYRPHRLSTYERWAASTPEHFRFSVKAPKTVSHAIGLATPELDAFFAESAGLGAKLGSILIQLPPKRAFVEADARQLLSAFRDRTNCGIVLEPRHASWFTEEVNDLLVDLKVARVAADPPRAPRADIPDGWSGLTYYRLHGSPVIYRSEYGEQRLKSIAQSVLAAMKSGSEPWCIFDNTTSYAATGDALGLLRAVDAD